MEYDNMIFAANLRRLLNKNNMKAIDLAERVGVSSAIVSQWLKGVKIPRMDKVARICKALDCSLEELSESDAAPSRDLTPAQSELLDLAAQLPDEDVAVLIAAAQAQLGSRKSRDGQG